MFFSSINKKIYFTTYKSILSKICQQYLREISYSFLYKVAKGVTIAVTTNKKFTIMSYEVPLETLIHFKQEE